jgi:hypothetical protein
MDYVFILIIVHLTKINQNKKIVLQYLLGVLTFYKKVHVYFSPIQKDKRADLAEPRLLHPPCSLSRR